VVVYCACQASMPPCSGRTFLKPAAIRRLATWAAGLSLEYPHAV
jgi:hypothetical protein